jgi:hypothetical protein
MTGLQLSDFVHVHTHLHIMNKYLFIQTIKRFGGSFYISLAAALQFADNSNFERLIAAFPELLTNYGPESPMYQTIEEEDRLEKLQDAEIFSRLRSC